MAVPAVSCPTFLLSGIESDLHGGIVHEKRSDLHENPTQEIRRKGKNSKGFGRIRLGPKDFI